MMPDVQPEADCCMSIEGWGQENEVSEPRHGSVRKYDTLLFGLNLVQFCA